MKLFLKSLFATLMVVYFAVSTSYAEKVTPEGIIGATTVDADTVKNWLDNGEEMIIIDPRKPSDYTLKGHIPTAISCPVNTDHELSDEVIARAVEHLSSCADLQGVSKKDKIVAYCNGIACWMSPKAVAALVKMGYSNVYWFRGGMTDWMAKDYPIE
ncbi:MAG: rhodanese-like domain-containing protein [Thermodesulfobacteriota bacterium]